LLQSLLARDDVKGELAAVGLTARPGPPADLARTAQAEQRLWAGLLKTAQGSTRAG
jgi:hypothetical protein